MPLTSMWDRFGSVTSQGTDASWSSSDEAGEPDEMESGRVGTSEAEAKADTKGLHKEKEKGRRGGKFLEEEDNDASSTTAHVQTRCGAPHTRLRVAGLAAGVAGVLFLSVLAVYLGLVATIEPPTITLNHCNLEDLAFDGPRINAVISFGGVVENKSKFRVLIAAPTLRVYYPSLEAGATLGTARLPEIQLPPLGTVVKDAHASFMNVNGLGGEEGTGPTPLGKQLVDEVLGKQTSTLGVTGGVHARAYIFGDRFPIPFPAKLGLSCPFVNHWGVEGDIRSECQTRLYPFWKRLE